MQTQRWHRSWENKRAEWSTRSERSCDCQTKATSNLHDDIIMCLREESVSGVLGRDSTGRLGFDADRVPADLTRESFQQLKYGLHIALLWRVITIQPPCSTLIRHLQMDVCWLKIDFNKKENVWKVREVWEEEQHCSYPIFILAFVLKTLRLLDNLLIHVFLKHFNCLITIDWSLLDSYHLLMIVVIKCYPEI